MDPSDPAPLALTTEELLPILDHLSTSRSHTASGSLLAIHSPIPLALLESTLDLLAQVQIEDERMDRLQKVDGEKRGKKRDTWGSLVGMMRMTHCASLLIHLASSSKPDARTGTTTHRPRAVQDSLESRFKTAMKRLLLPPSTLHASDGSTTTLPSLDMDKNGTVDAGSASSATKPHLYQHKTSAEEWDFLKSEVYERYERVYEVWLETGKFDRTALGQSPSIHRMASRLQRWVNEVIQRAEEIAAGSQADSASQAQVQVSKVMPTRPEPRQADSAKNDARDRRMDDEMDMDVELDVDRRIPRVDKGKQREVQMTSTTEKRSVSNIQPTPVTVGRPAKRTLSERPEKEAEGDADRLKRLKRTLNGGRELASATSGTQRLGTQEMDVGLEPPFKQERREGSSDLNAGVQTTQGGRRRTRFSVQGEQEAQLGRHSSPFQSESGRRQSIHTGSHYSPQQQQNLPDDYPADQQHSLSSHMPPRPRSSLPFRPAERERRERSISVLVPDLPPGTILRVNERGIAEPLKVEDGEFAMQDGGFMQEDYEDPYQHQLRDRDNYYDRNRDDGSAMDEDEMGWRGASLLDEDLDGDMDVPIDNRVDFGSGHIGYEGARPSAGPASRPEGYRWVLIPDEPEYEPINRRRSYATAGPPRQFYPRDMRRSEVAPAYYRSRSISNQERRSLPNWGQDARYSHDGRQPEIRRISVQPTSSAMARMRYGTPVPEGSRTHQSMLGKDPRRRHTDFARPLAGSPLASLSSQADARQTAPRRRQGYSLGGAERRLPIDTEERTSARREGVLADWVDNSFDDDSAFHPPPQASVPLPRSQEANRAGLEGQHARPPIDSDLAPVASSPSRPTPSIANRNSSPGLVYSQAPLSDIQRTQGGSSTVIQLHRPFNNNKVLRNPQNAKRARQSTGLHTGRPEFQLAGANEPQPAGSALQAKDATETVEVVASASKSARHREREKIVAAKEEAKRKAKKLFSNSDDDDDNEL
ncbi:hypothetical protein HD553DRAFT_351579 [Filobasidium floriforme]|uniref:uncharacterized protein n=1 Tax=Filobasidium floriforme TaxID=5210 RepID=UPI001E8EC35E|nr:uncharacterized protein HD553DRAFT_351579 [Filobasidium floriforme]KAH8081480.1 hypothetical protein HD553DRAFT_351579 [Filobasidium floriforme]